VLGLDLFCVGLLFVSRLEKERKWRIVVAITQYAHELSVFLQ
jgi:hypothetical protein